MPGRGQDNAPRLPQLEHPHEAGSLFGDDELEERPVAAIRCMPGQTNRGERIMTALLTQDPRYGVVRIGMHRPRFSGHEHEYRGAVAHDANEARIRCGPVDLPPRRYHDPHANVCTLLHLGYGLMAIPSTVAYPRAIHLVATELPHRW